MKFKEIIEMAIANPSISNRRTYLEFYWSKKSGRHRVKIIKDGKFLKDISIAALFVDPGVLNTFHKIFTNHGLIDKSTGNQFEDVVNTIKSHFAKLDKTYDVIIRNGVVILNPES